MGKKIDKSYTENLSYETDLIEQGYRYIAGVDEVGRGPFAGPVVAGAVIFSNGIRIDRLTDSKKLPKKEHYSFAEEIRRRALSCGIGIVSVEEIDKLNIDNACRLAMIRAIQNMQQQPDYLLVDGKNKLDISIPQTTIVSGDYFSHSISAASVLAKVKKDEILAQLDKEYDFCYGWSTNSGYLTAEHREACKKYGITKHHRKSWKNAVEFKKRE